MRVSVLACLALGVCALLGAVGPAAGEISDLQCKDGNSDSTGVCSGKDDPWKPTYNRADDGNGISYEVDRLYVSKVNLTTDQPDKHNDGQVDVHRITWEANSGVGNTGRNVSTTIQRELPAGFLPFPFQMSYRADGLNFEPRTDLWTPNLGQKVIFFEAEFLYILKGTIVQNQTGIFYPNGGAVRDDSSQLWLLFQPTNGFGLTAGPVSVYGTGEIPKGATEPKYYALGAVDTFGPRGTLPNNGLGTYFLTWRVVADNSRFAVTTDMAVTSGQTLQSVGGPNAPGNTYRVTKLANAYDAPVLSNLAVPAADGAFLTFTLTPVGAAAPGKVFISEAMLTIKSVTPVDGPSEGVRLSGTYTLDTSANSVAVDSFVQGTQKLYVRPTGATSNDWAPLANSAYNSTNKQVTYTLSASDANSFGSVPSLDMAVLADIPVSSSSSSTGESSSSSTAQEPVPSSTAQEPVPSSTAESSTAGPLSSTAQPSSSTAPPSSSTGASSSSAPSSTGAVPSGSSSSTAVPPSSSSSSGSSFSSSSGSFNSSSSSTAPSVVDGSASSVSANGVAVALAAAAAVAALYA